MPTHGAESQIRIREEESIFRESLVGHARQTGGGPPSRVEILRPLVEVGAELQPVNSPVRLRVPPVARTSTLPRLSRFDASFWIVQVRIEEIGPVQALGDGAAR